MSRSYSILLFLIHTFSNASYADILLLGSTTSIFLIRFLDYSDTLSHSTPLKLNLPFLIFSTISESEEESKGSFPLNIKNKITPVDQISHFVL